MINGLSLKQIKRQKVKMRKRLKENRITIKRLAESLSGEWHANTVYRALDITIPYYNKNVMDEADRILREGFMSEGKATNTELYVRDQQQRTAGENPDSIRDQHAAD